MGSKPNPQTQMGNQASQNQLAMQQNAANQVNQTTSQFAGPVNQSPLYQALLSSGTDATNNAFNSASSALRRNANAAGFGYSQPVTQGAQTELEGERAGALSQVPGQSLIQATGPALQAAGLQAGLAGQFGATGANYFGTATNAYNQQQQRNMGLFNALGKAGLGALAAVPGIGPFAGIAAGAAGGL